MKLSDLRPTPGSHQKEKRYGRGHGTGHGKTAGRGTKGQKARTGHSNVHRAFTGGGTRLVKRLPFYRGVGNSNTAFRDNYAIVNLGSLVELAAGSKVTPESLVEGGFLSNAEGKGLVKILGFGEIENALHVRAHKFSASAKSKIEAAGGSIEVIPVVTYEKTKRKKVQDQPNNPAAGEQEAQA